MAWSRSRGVRGALTIAAITGAVLGSTGCATVAHGMRQEVAMTSEPAGADVFINDVPVGPTPVRVSLKRRQATVLVRFEKEGFEVERLLLTRSISRWVAADVAVALNPMAGQGLDSAEQWPAMAATALATLLVVDFVTGGAFTFPSVVRAVLRPVPK